MAITAILALICIVLGLVGAIVDQKLLLPALEWFVLAIAFNTLGVGFTIGGSRGQAS